MNTLWKFAHRTALAYLIAALPSSASLALSQTTASRAGSEQVPRTPTFTVVSVKETKGTSIYERLQPDGYVAVGVNLNMLMMEAYGVPQLDRIVGRPTWSIEKRFDVQAKVDEADIPAIAKLPVQQRRAMIQQILGDQFKLRLHEEQQEQSIYTLAVAQKLDPFLAKSQPVDPTAPGGKRITRSRRGELGVERFTMANIADQLSGIVHKYVVDQTNLNGLYDMHLAWDPDYASTVSTDSPNSHPDSPTAGTSIFTALKEQLGLELKPGKGPVTVWVIDHVELPASN